MSSAALTRWRARETERKRRKAHQIRVRWQQRLSAAEQAAQAWAVAATAVTLVGLPGGFAEHRCSLAVVAGAQSWLGTRRALGKSSEVGVGAKTLQAAGSWVRSGLSLVGCGLQPEDVLRAEAARLLEWEERTGDASDGSAPKCQAREPHQPGSPGVPGGSGGEVAAAEPLLPPGDPAGDSRACAPSEAPSEAKAALPGSDRAAAGKTAQQLGPAWWVDGDVVGAAGIVRAANAGALPKACPLVAVVGRGLLAAAAAAEADGAAARGNLRGRHQLPTEATCLARLAAAGAVVLVDSFGLLAEPGAAASSQPAAKRACVEAT